LRLILAVLLITFSLHGYSQTRSTQVVVQALTKESQKENVEAVGTAEAYQSVNIYSAAADRVTGVYFSPGELVEKDAVLLELDDRRQKVAVQRAAIELKDATRNLERLQLSKNNGAVTQSALDEAATIKELAKVALLEANVELDDRTVVAPFTGIVGLSDVEVGDRISSETLITTIDNRDRLFVNFNAPESGLNALIKNDSKVSLQPWSDRNTLITASIGQIDSRVDTQNRTLRIRAIFDNTQEYLPGMSFRVSIEVMGESFFSIPESGLSWGTNGAYVWIVNGELAKRVDVQVKQRLKGRVLVDGDLKENQLLIVEGIQRLREDQVVEIVETRKPL